MVEKQPSAVKLLISLKTIGDTVMNAPLIKASYSTQVNLKSAVCC